MTGFLLVALIGFKRNLWLVAAALAAQGVFDFFTAVAFLAWLLGRSYHTSVSSSGQ